MSKELKTRMDHASLEAVQAEIQEDILKLQLHSTPLNLAWGPQDEEEEDDDDEDTILEPVSYDANQPSTSGINNMKADQRGITSIIDVSDDELEDAEEEEEIDLSKDLEATGENILKLNIAYQEVIQMQLQFVKELLQENRQRQEDLIEELNAPKSGGKQKSKHHPGVNIRVNTYTHNHFHQLKSSAPHADVLRRMNEVGDIFEHIPFPCIPWKKHEDEKLIKGVERGKLKDSTEPLLSQLEYLRDKYSTKEDPGELQKILEVEAKIGHIKEKKFVELIGDVTEQHDWEAISNMDMEGNRTTTECSLRWKNYLHPSINHKNWSKKEESNLKKLAKKHLYRGWKQIAEELGTGRTAMQCIQKYQRTNKDHTQQPWPPEEDEKLKSIVGKCIVGNTIPFTYVALHMGNRSNKQVCHRWMRSVNPIYKKSKWEPEEDVALLRAIVKFGPKWSVIRDSGMVPGRNDSQCRERWDNCLRNVNRDPWTAKEDRIIRRLVETHGLGKWSTIAQGLNRRTDNQVIHRWKYITKMQEKGEEVVYKKKGPKTIVDGLSAVRQRLVNIIEQQAQKKATGSNDVDTDEGTLTAIQERSFRSKNSQPKDTEELSPLPLRQVIRTTKSRKKWRWLESNFLKRMDSAKTPQEVISLYKDLSGEVGKVINKPKPSLAEELQSDTLISKLAISVVSAKFRPYQCMARRNGTNINEIRNQVLTTATEFDDKSIFVHYVRAMNIDPQRTLQVIQKTQQKDQEKSKDAGSVATKKSTFSRDHFLPMCAPNQGTLPAFRRLIQDKERRLKNAKLMLIDGKKQKASNSTTSEVDTEDHANSAPFTKLYNGNKYNAESLIKNIQKMPEHKMLRSRFVSLFAWPTVLSTVVPYKRSGPFKILKPAISMKIKAGREDDGPPAKRSKT